MMAVLATFMRTFVEKKIPRSGGIAIIGWSIGNLTTMLFSDPDVIERETKTFLEAYLKVIILYGTFLTKHTSSP